MVCICCGEQLFHHALLQSDKVWGRALQLDLHSGFAFVSSNDITQAWLVVASNLMLMPDCVPRSFVHRVRIAYAGAIERCRLT